VVYRPSQKWPVSSGGPAAIDIHKTIDDKIELEPRRIAISANDGMARAARIPAVADWRTRTGDPSTVATDCPACQERVRST